MPLRVSCLGPVLRLACPGGGGGSVLFPPYLAWGCALPVGRVCAPATRGVGGGAAFAPFFLTVRPGGAVGRGSPCLGPFLCLLWAGNKAGVLGVALAMEGVAPTPLRFMLACCSRARSVWRPCVLARVRLSIAVPAGAGGWGVEAGPAPASLLGAAVLLGAGGTVPSASGGAGGLAPPWPAGRWGGWRDRGGVAPWLPASSLWGGRPVALCPVPTSSPAHLPQVYAFGRGRGAAPGAGCGLPPVGQPGGGGGRGGL